VPSSGLRLQQRCGVGCVARHEVLEPQQGRVHDEA